MALRGLKKHLVENSLDAYILSLETINRLSVKYRIESFTILLKAKIIDVHGKRAIYYQETRGAKKRTLSVSKCLESVFPNESDARRLNLERVIELRDESVHLVIAAVPTDVLELLQSCVLNYHDCLKSWFGISLSDRVPMGMMTIVYDTAPLLSSVASIRQELGADEIKFLTKFQADLRNDAERVGYSQEFIARVEHNVIVRNHQSQADVQLTGGPGGAPVGIVDRPRDPAITHPFRTMASVEKVQEELALDPPYNTYDFQAAVYHWNVKRNNTWHYCSTLQNSVPQYSQLLIDKVVAAYRADPDLRLRLRTKYRNRPGSAVNPRAEHPQRGE